MKFLKRVILITSASILSLAFFIITGYFALYLYSCANIDKEADERLFSFAKEDSVSRIYVNSAPLFSGEYIPKELELYGKGDRKSTVKLSETSDYVRLGFIATEDREFFMHNGVNVRRTIAALLNSVFKFDKRFGASTITQQVVKNISGDNEITFKRKLNEIIRATLIEKNHTKEEILELYINIVPLGERCVGIKMGSLVYFDKEPIDLSLSEAALLVGITNAPSRLNP
ncbi:MAG: transglycosylase domain-containing protein [Clostridia bacterium]|nr:transglycosylase domain-containing protein [Clostridia bacterium]